MLNLAIIIPGFTRSAPHIRPFVLELAQRGPNVQVFSMPGHALDLPHLPNLSMSTLVEHFRAILQPAQPSLLIGESLGGLIAMALAHDPPPGIRAVCAIDPPVLMEKQTGLQEEYRIAEDLHGLWAAYAKPIFGLTREAGQVRSDNRDYRNLLATRPIIPVHVLAGRRETGLGPTTLDSEDRALIARAPGFTLHTTAPDVGHLPIDEAPKATIDLILSLMRTS